MKQTTGDEAGERAEKLRITREMHERRCEGYPNPLCSGCFLLSELNRMTAERDRLSGLLVGFKNDLYSCDKERIEAKDLGQRIADERDAALASRNAWAEKCGRMVEALELAAPHHQGFHSKVGRAIKSALAATEEKL
jgi:hypothetical protein